MVKISRPIIYVLLLGVVGYAVLVLTEPEKVTKKPSTKNMVRATTTLKGFTAEDMTARFPRYLSAPRDAFQPKVIPTAKNIGTLGSTASGGGIAELWALTGVSTVNNVVNALVECASTGESVFLKVGDTWKGCRVRAIEPNTVQLVSNEGAPIQLGFADPLKPKVNPGPGAVPGGTVTPILLPSAAPAPGGAVVPVDPALDRGGRRANGRGGPAPEGDMVPVDPTEDRAARKAGKRAGRRGGGGQE